MTRMLKDMTVEEESQYRSLLMKLTKAVLPADVDDVVIVMLTNDKMVHFVCSSDFPDRSLALREVAALIDSGRSTT